MSKLKALKSKNKAAPKTKLSAEQKKFGKTQITILFAMIAVGLALALYNMQ